MSNAHLLYESEYKGYTISIFQTHVDMCDLIVSDPYAMSEIYKVRMISRDCGIIVGRSFIEGLLFKNIKVEDVL